MAQKAAPGKRATDRINNINIGLMIVSAVLAFVWPFYLFLIAYAVLGPLHYLTEISWLHDRAYFTNQKRDYLFLVAAGLIYGLSQIDQGGLFNKHGLSQVLGNVIVIAFLGSLVFALTRKTYWRGILIASGLLLLVLVPMNFSIFILSMLLLTVIHVFFFTGLFIWFGALKSSSKTGYISLAVFLLLAVLMFIYQPLPGAGVADAFVVKHYQAFTTVNLWFIRTFNLSALGAHASDAFEFSPGALAVMRFLTFAYLYHYLNWFSKTKIIRWHEVSKSRLATVLGLWATAIVIYAIDYDMGLKVLFTLSAMHVLLEFPLDIRTMVGIGTELRKRARFASLSRNGDLELQGSSR